MTATGGHRPRIPSGHVKLGLRGNLNTGRTVDDEGPDIKTGTRSAKLKDVLYESLPPAKEQPDIIQNWTLEKIGSYLGIGIVVLSGCLFFYGMSSNVGDIKEEVKDTNAKLNILDEKINKQQSNIENVESSVQRLESEIRRTQDYIQDNKR